MEKPTQKIKLTPGNRRPKGRRSAPKTEARQTGKEEQFAYTFKDEHLGEMPVLNSANAWWLDSGKVQKLIDAYKFYATDDQACFYAGITSDQLEYFQKLHPDFYGIKHAAKQRPTLQAKQTVVNQIEKNPEGARWWLERIEKDSFSTRQEQTGRDGRDLYDGLSERLLALGEEIRQYGSETKTKEHARTDDAGDDDAGSDRVGDEARVAAGPSVASEVSA